MQLFFSIILVSLSFSISAQVRVATSFSILADMVRQVGGDAVSVHSIVRVGVDIHNYQPTPKDVLRANQSDVIFWNGLGLELWFERFFRDTHKAQHFTVSEGVTPLSIHGGGYDGKPNAHAWMSIHNAIIYIDNIEKALSSVDPAQAISYKKNAEAYKVKLRLVQSKLIKKLSTIPPRQRYLVTSEGAFSYLAASIGFKEIYLWPTNADQQGTPQQMRRAIEAVRQAKVPVVFSESTVSDRPAKQLARETKARYGGVLYVDSLSRSDGKAPHFLGLLRFNAEAIVRGFGQ